MNALATESAAPAARPSVIIEPDEGRVAREVIAALPEIDGLYQRGGRLVEVAHESGATLPGLVRQAGGPRIRTLPKAILRKWIADRCELLKYNRYGELVASHPPDWLVDVVREDGAWPGVRHLEAVVQSPMFLRSGRVLQQPGYDPYSGLYLDLEARVPFVPVPERPSARQVAAAVKSLNWCLVDFLFERPEHRSAWIAGFLTFFARFAFRGGAPLFLIDSNVRGGGKSLLCQTAGHICLGRDMDFSTQPSDDADQKKILKTVSMSGALLVQIDNIDRPFGNGVFDGALTSTVWTDTPLYTDDRISTPLYAIWWATGNNVEFRRGSDTSSRTIHIRLNVPDERPEERSNFEHPDILEYVRKNRGELVCAGLTLLRAYANAGYPDQGLKAWSRFPNWSRLIRHCIVWAGMADPYMAHEQLIQTADTTHVMLGDLLEGWAALCDSYKVPGMTVRDVLAELEGHLEERQRNSRFELPNERLINALLELAPTKHGRLADPHTVGLALRKHRGRVVRGLRLEQLEQKTNRGAAWAAQRVQ